MSASKSLWMRPVAYRATIGNASDRRRLPRLVLLRGNHGKVTAVGYTRQHQGFIAFRRYYA